MKNIVDWPAIERRPLSQNVLPPAALHLKVVHKLSEDMKECRLDLNLVMRLTLKYFSEVVLVFSLFFLDVLQRGCQSRMAAMTTDWRPGNAKLYFSKSFE